MITQFQRLIHRHGRWIFLILLGVIIISFLLWDYGTMGRMDSSRTPTIRVYGRTVSPRELETSKKLYRLNLQLATGQPVETNSRADRLIQQKTLEQMAMAEKAVRMGISVNDQEVEAEARSLISQMRRAYFPNVKSDEEAFSEFVNMVLEPRALTVADLDQMLRTNLVLKKLAHLLTSTVHVTPQEVEQYALEQLEKKNASFIRFDVTDYMSQVKASPEDLRRYYELNTNMFMVSDQVRVAYVLFPPKEVGVTVSEEEIKSIYDANKAAFMKPDGTMKALKDVSDTLRQEIRRQKALEASESEATEFTVKLAAEPGKAAPTFDDLAKQKGLSVKQTDFFSKTEIKQGIPREFARGVDLSMENRVSDPILSSEGVYVLSLLEKKPSYLPAFEKVKDSVKASYEAKKALEMAREAGEKARQETVSMLASGKKFDQISSALKLHARTLKPFNALDRSPTEAYEMMAHRAAAKVRAGEVSDLVPDTTGGFFVYVQSVEAPKPDDLAKFKPQAQVFLAQTGSRPVFEDFHRLVVKEGLPASFAEDALKDVLE